MHKETAENYLRAIYHIQEEKGTVKSIDLCRYLHIGKSSISEMIRNLAEKNLVCLNPYSTIRLTKKGLSRSMEITRKHRPIEAFLSEFLGIKSSLHEEAHRLEHAFSEESIGSIRKMVADSKHCPHGKPIPGG